MRANPTRNSSAFFKAMDARVARQTWELENRIEPVTQRDADAIYRYDEAAQAANIAAKPWTKDPHYFKTVRISALALLKMVVHARSGGNIEVRPSMFFLIPFQLSLEPSSRRITAN